MRFKEGRKFRELAGANFKLAVNAEKIDYKLKWLKWISPQYKNPKTEILLINQTKKILKNDERNIIEGTAPSSPVNPNLKRKFSITTIVSIILWIPTCLVINLFY